MGFSLLSFLALKFKKASKTNKDFKKFLMGHECRVVIKTKDGKRGKRFIFKDGKFSSDTVLNEYDAAMIWSDAETGFKGLRMEKKESSTHSRTIWSGLTARYILLPGLAPLSNLLQRRNHRMYRCIFRNC